MVWLWLAGLGVMLGRLFWSVHGAQRMGRLAEPCQSEHVLQLVRSLSRSLGIGRRVAVRMHPDLQVPAVVGMLRPIILLPAASITGLTTQQLEAVLLHELAHIRRHDLVVQFGQMLVEAVLFFNPVVWWISRQVRIEREACADSAAAGALGEPDRYVQVLADWAERLRSGVAAGQGALPANGGLGFAGKGEYEHSLLDRARRLLVPGYHPELKLPWSTVAGLLLAGAVLLSGLWQGTNLAVEVAAQILTPQERNQAIEQVRKTHGEPAQREVDPNDPANRVTVAGTVRMADGSPVPDGLVIFGYAIWERTDSSGTASFSFGTKDGRFEYEKFQPANEYYLYVRGDDYAPNIVGPLEAEPGGRIDGIEIVVSKGFASTLRIVDPQGKPVADAQVKHNYPLRARRMTIARPSAGPEQTDAEGLIPLQHAAQSPLQVEVRKPGYQFERFEVTPIPEGVHELRLSAVTPATGTVVDRETGKPIRGATIRMVRRTGSHATTLDPYAPDRSPLLGTSDEDGRYTLDTIREDAFYTLRIDAPGHGPELIYDVHAGQVDQVWELGPPRVIQGRVIAGLDQLDRRRGQPKIWYEMSVQMEESSYYNNSFSVPVRIEKTAEGEAGTFKTYNLLPGSLTLRAVTPPVRIDTRSLPTEPLELDLRRPAEQDHPQAMREVVLRVVVPDGMPQAQGTLRLDYLESIDSPGYKPVFGVALKDGEVRYQVPVPTKVKGRGQQVTGYLVPDSRDMQVPKGDEPFVIDLPAVPAGAVYGKIFEADGSPATRVHMSRVVVEQPVLPDGIRPDPNNLKVEGPDKEGRFMVSPLPLGGVYRLVASGSGIGNSARVISEPFRLDEATPLHEIELRFVEGLAVSGTVTDEQGEPLIGVPMDLHYSTPWSHGFGGGEIVTDTQGRFKFSNVNPDLPGHYTLRVGPGAGCQGRSIKFKPSDKPMKVELEPGKRLHGTVIDVATGKLMANARIQAWPWGHEPGKSNQPVNTRTDAKGRFTFGNLEDREYLLKVDDTWPEGTTTYEKDGRTWYRSPPGDINHFHPKKEAVQVRVTSAPEERS